MNLILNVEGTNKGAEFIKNYVGQTIELESLYQNISENSPPLANIKTKEGEIFSFQLVDVRFINQNIFINGFLMNEKEKSGGKALLRFSRP